MSVASGHKKNCPGCRDPKAFHLLTAAYMTELLRKGAKDADELDRQLRPQFMLDAAARNLVLR